MTEFCSVEENFAVERYAVRKPDENYTKNRIITWLSKWSDVMFTIVYLYLVT